jgi:cysteine desulfuration protein SufE
MWQMARAGAEVATRERAVNMHDPQKAQQEIISDFSLFDNWLDRYQYLIDLGKALEPLDESEKTDDILLHGCQSRVWLIIEGNADEMIIRANSDAAIVSGLIALLIKAYSGASAKQILNTQPEFIAALGLQQHLSATRANGLYAMLEAIFKAAKSHST